MAVAAATDTVSVSCSTRVVVTAVESTATAPFELAEVSLTTIVSPGSSTLSVLVGMVIVPLDAAEPIVSLRSLGAV